MLEHGAVRNGEPQSLDRRLFAQLLLFDGCGNPAPLIATLTEQVHPGVLYRDVHNPRGVGLLTLAEDPGVFTTSVPALVGSTYFADLDLLAHRTLLGRTYAMGYEPDLVEALFNRPRRHALTPSHHWAVWYPLRRSGQFNRLPAEEQRDILMEHGRIGMAFGAHDLAHDIRLMCYGLDQQDNDFVVGLMGSDLHPLSAVVQAMRKTQQTALYLESLGPFFVGRAIWQAPMSVPL